MMIRMLSYGIFILFITFTSCQSSKELTFTGTTKSGFPYVMHIDKDGDSPQVGDRISYSRGVRLGKDSILAEQQSMSVVLPGVDVVSEQAMAEYEILFLLSAGDSVSVYIMGDKVTNIPGFKPEDTIVFDIVFNEIEMTKELVEQERTAILAREASIATEMDQTIKDYKSGKLAGQLQTTEEGLKYIIHEPGEGASPESGSNLKVHYYGMLTDGTMFDNSYRRGDAFEFPVGQGRVIPGWDLGLMLLKKGGKATFFIPSQLGYGEQGSPPNIPANAELVFYIELLDF